MNRILATYFALPYSALLLLVRPWRSRVRVRECVRFLLEPFMWLNTLWVISPILAVVYLLLGALNWLMVIALYVVAVLLLHSGIAHSTGKALKVWEAVSRAPQT